MAGYYYWGGKRDLETELTNEGYTLYTVSVGPISPNWDRAIETFYQIKGDRLIMEMITLRKKILFKDH